MFRFTIRDVLWLTLSAALACVIFILVANAWRDHGRKTIVAWNRGARPSTFANGLGTYYEGLVIALLGSCSVEADATIANQPRWEQALKQDHLRVQFAKPRVLVVDVEQAQVEAEEILVPISESDSPDYIFVRNGTSYRAFGKYEWQICHFIQTRLQSLREP